MHTNLTTTTPATPPPAAPTRDEKLERAHRLVSNAFRHADDESIERLSWSDRDEICRQLSEAMRLIKEAI